MNDPARGFPSPTSCANALMLKFAMDVAGVTAVWLSNPAGWRNNKNTYLPRQISSRSRIRVGKARRTGARQTPRVAWAAESRTPEGCCSQARVCRRQ